MLERILTHPHSRAFDAIHIALLSTTAYRSAVKHFGDVDALARVPRCALSTLFHRRNLHHVRGSDVMVGVKIVMNVYFKH